MPNKCKILVLSGNSVKHGTEGEVLHCNGTELASVIRDVVIGKL